MNINFYLIKYLKQIRPNIFRVNGISHVEND